jgi:integrase/recombinase XerD
MLEQIIIRKSFLKKHLAAPLLKEREYFLTMKSKEGLSRLTLLGWAGYSLKFIQYFDLHDGEKRIVSLDDVVEAARQWSSPFLIIIILGNGMIALPQESNSLRWLLNSYYT